MVRALVLVLALLGVTPAARADDAGGPIRVLVPHQQSLQYFAFWLALGSGAFEREGVKVDVGSPEHKVNTRRAFLDGQVDVAVLPPPVYLDLIAQREPIVLVANLLANDPLNLIVKRSAMEQLGTSQKAPLADRLRALKGKKLGVAPGPIKRMNALFASAGLKTDEVVEVVIVAANEQNAAFGEGRVDVLLSHTPYLERAVVDQDAVVLVHGSGGDVPELSGLQIHSLVVRKSFVDQRASDVAAMVRAIHSAGQLARSDAPAATDALMKAVPNLSLPHAVKFLEICGPALPADPRVTVDGLLRAIELFPEHLAAPAPDRTALAPFIDARFAEEAIQSLKPAPPVASVPLPIDKVSGIAAAGAVVVLALAWLVLKRRST